MTNTLLKDTSLCAIVRDEMINPAGGIERFVRSIVPHVEQAVILDTGSIDGTREKLEKLKAEFSQMQIYDRPFDDYINSRNASLKKVQTKWTLVLDADELITQYGFKKLKPILENEKDTVEGFNFEMRVVLPDENGFTSSNLHNPRLFRNRDCFRYGSTQGNFWEYLYDYSSDIPGRVIHTKKCKDLEEKTLIYHFMPTGEANRMKYREWYDPAATTIDFGTFKRAPSTVRGFAEWKAFNPKRDKYT